MIFCRTCEIALSDDTISCPLCHRNPRANLRWALIAGGALWGSGRIKNRVQRWDEEVLKAAESLVATNPAVKNPVGFSSVDQTTVEHWDGRRWRVSGYIDTRPQPGGAKVRALYFAVLLNNGKTWDLEDLQLQSMEFGSGTRRN